MAIVKGIDPGAVLFKFSAHVWTWGRDPATNQHGRVQIPSYYVIKLYTRRARTNGAFLDREKLAAKPFLESLKIRMRESGIDYETGQKNYYAIGCDIHRIGSKEEWEAIEIDETAKEYYDKRVKNDVLSDILNKDTAHFSEEEFEELRNIIGEELEEDATEWPGEPHIGRFNRYEVDDIDRIPPWMWRR